MVPASPSRSTRAAIATAVALAAVAYVVAYARANPDFVSDFDQLWAGARALWDGKDPYRVVGPRGSFLWKWPLYYPAPAVILLAPLGLLPVVAARAVFTAVSAGLFAFASRTETQGLVLAEALAAGLPAVAIAGPGVADSVRDGVDGVIVAAEPESTRAARLGSELARLVEDRDERTRLAAAARDGAERFDIGRRIGEVEALYRSVPTDR